MKNIIFFVILAITLSIMSINAKSASHKLQSEIAEQKMTHHDFEYGKENAPENNDSFKKQEQADNELNTDINDETQDCQNNLLCEIQIAMVSEDESENYAKTTHSPPHFYVKLQPMTSSKKQCKQTAKSAMVISGFTDITHGKHGIWGVKQGYKAQIKCSQAEKVIVFIVVGEKGKTVMQFNDQLQRNFGQGFSMTRDP
ncbi:hypothetical protein [Candidatus Parabeggiatoa sp. HSG14]|uniref:hypothetical protein n=1 Tax=Candidatus Parabeggiatoa sp. HSG14 TaxID=3055593 RepID=UPI0025A78179|nr:hypothetical protein [Thiotrichales bacterium HSG14]